MKSLKTIKKISPLEESAQEKASKFFRDNNITLDYSVVEDRLLELKDGFVLKPKKPLVKITFRYDR